VNQKFKMQIRTFKTEIKTTFRFIAHKMTVEFYKYQGTGNDFIILDNRDKKYNNIDVAQIQHLCNRRFGVGADGLMLLNLNAGYDFEMKYYNADGRESSMCGNGGRCLVQFAYDMGMKKTSYHFIAIDGPHEASFEDNGWVRLKMKDVKGLTTSGGDVVLDTGSPHYVKIVDNVKNHRVVDDGKQIRYRDEFSPGGLNVNFVQLENDRIIVRTYERGVEDETLSCGTGVTACALVCGQTEGGFNRKSVETPGGNLAVEFNKIDHDVFEDIWLCGPATFVYKGQIDISI
jgi:diaminopimelate epimerase